ncbi:hypothetical protein EI94DRAFT_1299842 [Lactarius quietus]|nr:hypothetical protein EI94DRAFT_1299842 [Lactarius quietus]
MGRVVHCGVCNVFDFLVLTVAGLFSSGGLDPPFFGVVNGSTLITLSHFTFPCTILYDVEVDDCSPEQSSMPEGFNYSGSTVNAQASFPLHVLQASKYEHRDEGELVRAQCNPPSFEKPTGIINRRKASIRPPPFRLLSSVNRPLHLRASSSSCSPESFEQISICSSSFPSSRRTSPDP